MCRIFGYLSKKTISKNILHKVSLRQINGGPDEQGLIEQKEWALGNNRLAIQGISGGHQPFYLSGIYCVFNGEIYNHNQLRKTLLTKGYAFSDECDGSIIPALYLEYGLDFVKKLDGMFAIAVIDTRHSEKNKLFIFSDPVGIKSVYFTYNNNEKAFSFASEIQALTEFKLSPNEIRIDAIEEYLSGRAIWGSNTIYNDIKQLEPSKILSFDVHNGISISTYESDIDAEIESRTLDEAGFELHNIIEEEVKQMLSADVPACVVTSGGLDSSYITAIASKFSPGIHSFNVAYAGKWPFDEREYAQKVAKQYNTQHHQIEIQENEFPDYLEKMLNHIGQPNTAPHCISTYALFSEVRKQGFKLAITGEGADEMFGGYKRFANATFDDAPNWMDNYLDSLSSVNQATRLASYSERYKKILVEKGFHDLYCKNILTELQKKHSKLDALLHFDQDYRFPYYILRRVDHLSMANSVEVRVPFCQLKIRSLARKLPIEYKLDKTNVKKILYSAAKGKLDDSILNRPKQPFTLPIAAMLKEGHPLMNIAENALFSEKFKNRNIFNHAYVKRLFNSQMSKPNNIAAETIWSLTTMELWMQMNKCDFRVE